MICMSDQPIVGKKEILTVLSTGLGIGLSIWIANISSPKGVMELQSKTVSEIVGAVSVLFVGVISYTYQLWRRDRKRERVRFAREMGRHICGCTDTGEIMLLKDRSKMSSEYECPRCKSWKCDFIDTTMFPPKP
jgi:hypothetical protein